MTTDDHSLLRKLHAILEVEAKLTATMEHAEPWLTSAPPSSFPSHRVRPIPTSLEEVVHVLAVARSLAARTSAPAGWNPSAPVVGFSTPNPLPHQLRGGALAALQLEQTKLAERERKRLKSQAVAAESTAAAAFEQPPTPMDVEETVTPTATTRDPKRREVEAHEHVLERSKSELDRSDVEAQQRRRSFQQPETPKQDVSMNLSSSSGSSSSDSSDDGSEREVE